VRGSGDVLISATRPPQLTGIGDWPTFLADGVASEEAERLRRFQSSGLPLGSDAFVADIERAMGRRVMAAPRGRPRRDERAGVAA
jgi:putative transposase